MIEAIITTRDCTELTPGREGSGAFQTITSRTSPLLLCGPQLVIEGYRWPYSWIGFRKTPQSANVAEQEYLVKHIKRKRLQRQSVIIRARVV